MGKEKKAICFHYFYLKIQLHMWFFLPLLSGAEDGTCLKEYTTGGNVRGDGFTGGFTPVNGIAGGAGGGVLGGGPCPLSGPECFFPS